MATTNYLYERYPSIGAYLYGDGTTSSSATDTLYYYTEILETEMKEEKWEKITAVKWKKPKPFCKRNYRHTQYTTKRNKKKLLNIEKQHC